MKKMLLFSLLIVALTSCSKDSIDQNIDSFSKPVKSEIMVMVSYLSWNTHGEATCGNTSSEVISFIANAQVKLYHGNNSEKGDVATPVMNVKTDSRGSVLLKDVEPDIYTVSVETPLGLKSRMITTQIHKRSFIDFSF